MRSVALRLMLERGYAAVTIPDVSAALGVSPSAVESVFRSPRAIVTENDHFAALVRNLRESPVELSCAGAWLVGVEETAEDMSLDEWQTETDRQVVLAAAESEIGSVVSEIVATMTALTLAVAERTAHPAGSTNVSVFVGTILGTMLSMPTSFYPDPESWVAAHAVAIEALGPSLDRLLI